MSLASDTEWLRAKLGSEAFHRDYPQRWLAVRDGQVVFNHPENAAMLEWLEREDPKRLCVIAFADSRVLA